MKVIIGCMYVPKYAPAHLDADAKRLQEELLDKRPTPCLAIRLAHKFWRWA